MNSGAQIQSKAVRVHACSLQRDGILVALTKEERSGLLNVLITLILEIMSQSFPASSSWYITWCSVNRYNFFQLRINKDEQKLKSRLL